MIHEITVTELKAQMDEDLDFTLIDVREAQEKQIADIGGTLIPLSEVITRKNEIPQEGLVVMYCRSGGRSGEAIRILQERFQYSNLVNLRGGILEWSDRIDSNVPRY
jgi:adenylyltransferase/sulfurtransferase